VSALRVAVVGGGVTGLAAAHALARRAAGPDGPRLELTLLEADDRLGGKVQTEPVGGLLFERGPDALFLRSPFALDLCQRLGLGDQVVRADAAHRQSYVLRGGRLHPIPSGMEGGVPRSVWPMAGSGLLSPLGKLRAALEVARPASHKEDDESVDGFIRRRFGAEVADRIASPLLGGIYNNDTRRLSLLATTPHLRPSGSTAACCSAPGEAPARARPRPGRAGDRRRAPSSRSAAASAPSRRGSRLA
jgi:oxygen-dependent protoporphyrinogen oxidase